MLRKRRKRHSLFLSAFLIVVLLLCCSVVSAQNVRQQYRRYFVKYTDKRSITEKVFNLAGVTNADVGRSFALLCGISKYPNMSSADGNLTPAAEDIRKLQWYLQGNEFFDEIVVLKNEQVTTANLEYFLQGYFADRLKKFPKSRFLFAYSGHGMTQNQNGYLLKSTARSLDDKGHAIHVNVLKVYIDEVIAAGHQVLVLLNSCHSGVFLKRPYGKLLLLPKYPGAHAITASGPSELAWHIEEVGSGSIFYEKLLAGISGSADAEKDGIVTSHELFTYLRREIQLVTDQDQNPQMGDISKHGSRGEFFFLNRETPLVRQEGVTVSGGIAHGGSAQEVVPESHKKVASKYRVDIEKTDSGGGTWGKILRMNVRVEGSDAIFSITSKKGPFYKTNSVTIRSESHNGAIVVAGKIPRGNETAKLKLDLDSVNSFSHRFFAIITNDVGYAWVGPVQISKNETEAGHGLYTYLRREIHMVTDQGQNPQMGNISQHDSRGEFFFLNRDTPLVWQEGVTVSGWTAHGGSAQETWKEPSYLASSQQDRRIGQYIDHGNGTVTDTKTGLMWKRCTEGLSGESCEHGKGEKYSYNDAIKRSKDVNYAGYSDWRLPSIDELKTLVYCSKGKEKESVSEVPTINQQAFPNTEVDWLFWSGSPSAVNSDDLWVVDFNCSYCSLFSRDGNYAVRLVRNGVRLENKTEGRIDLSYLQRGEQRERKIGQYIDHGNGTITDTKTGLMWKRCAEGLSGDNCERGKAEEYEFDDAVKRFKHVVAYAGYSDWRLPTVDELKTLVYCSKGKDKIYGVCNKGSERPTINQQAFPNTKNWAYWSVSPDASNSVSAWNVNFNNGDSDAGSRDGFSAVRLLRSGQSPIKLQPLPKAEKLPQKDKTIGQYIDHDDGTITDTKTGLIWKRCSEGLSGDNCEDGEVEGYTWGEAVQRFKNVEYVGYSDWRLPTVDELKTLVYCSNGVKNEDDVECNDGSEQPTINELAFPNTPARWYWSGSLNADFSFSAWVVLFDHGYSHAFLRSYTYAVRLVRGISKTKTFSSNSKE